VPARDIVEVTVILGVCKFLLAWCAASAVKNNWPYTMNDILESEYFIMEEMSFKMVSRTWFPLQNGR
jgi:hypothetical protein